MKRVLVTGATGCVGRHVVPALLARGWEVHAVSSRHLPDDDTPGLIRHRADLLKLEALDGLVRSVRASHLLHLAWNIEPGRWATAPQNVTWVQASLGLLRAFAEQGGVRIVSAGSCLEYDWSYGYCSEERTPCSPHTVYGVCKQALQMLTSAFATTNGMTSAWGRMFNLYGPHEHPDRLVASVIRSLLVGEPARCSHGNQIRDYLFAQDAADAFVALLESDITGPINIASGQPVAVKEIVLRIGTLLGAAHLIRLGAIPEAPTDVPLVVADVGRVTRELNWRPQYDLDSGLTRTIEWWREHSNARETAGRQP
jgi:nucleoside-diphosphate-sugar epimerase